MLEHVPAWLGKALKSVRAGHGKLAIATLGAEDMLNKGGFRLTSRLSTTAKRSTRASPPTKKMRSRRRSSGLRRRRKRWNSR